jgi:hypothetical protein
MHHDSWWRMIDDLRPFPQVCKFHNLINNYIVLDENNDSYDTTTGYEESGIGMGCLVVLPVQHSSISYIRNICSP